MHQLVQMQAQQVFPGARLASNAAMAMLGVTQPPGRKPISTCIWHRQWNL